MLANSAHVILTLLLGVNEYHDDEPGDDGNAVVAPSSITFKSQSQAAEK